MTRRPSYHADCRHFFARRGGWLPSTACAVVYLSTTAVLHSACGLSNRVRPGPESSPRSVWMSKGDFDQSIRELVPAKWIPEEDKQRLSQARGRRGAERYRERKREREMWVSSRRPNPCTSLLMAQTGSGAAVSSLPCPSPTERKKLGIAIEQGRGDEDGDFDLLTVEAVCGQNCS